MDHMTGYLHRGLLVLSVFTCGCGTQAVQTGPSTQPPLQAPGPANINGPILAPPGQSSLRVSPELSRSASGSPEFDDAPSVPASSVLKPTTPQSGRYHEVVRGDTLSAIARKYDVPLQRLLEANGLTRDSILQPEQLIYIPPDR